MAIVISRSSGLNDDLWKPVGQIINAVMQDTDSEKTQYDSLVSQLAVEKKSKKYAEKQTGITSTGSFDIVAEGGKAPLDDIEEAFPKLIIHSTFKKNIAMTREMLDDGDLDGMKVMAKNLVMSFKRTRAELITAALCSEGSSITYGGQNLDRTTGDGKALFATDHLGKKDGVATQSNVFTNAFGATNAMLVRLANIGRNYKNDSGVVTGFAFDTIVIPGNCPALEETVTKIIRSDLIVGSANNDVNTQKGKWKLVVDPLWQAAAGASPYILMSSEAMKAYNGTLFYDRTALDVKSEVELSSRNLMYNGFGRCSAGFGNWRHLIMGGATTGTTLT